MPPVTKTGMPANPAPMSVPLTVVAPRLPFASTTGMSRRDTLATPGSEASRSRRRAVAAHLHRAVHHRHGRRDRSLLAHNAFHLQRGLEVGGVRHAVGHNGGLQRHHRLSFALRASLTSGKRG